MAQGKIRIATCQFAESFQPRRNGAMVIRYLRRAHRAGADLVHFHEGAMTGYLARKGAPDPADYDWTALREATEGVMAQARRLGLWVALGSAHPLTPPHRPTNCLYLIGPDGKIRDRYDKRFCTREDCRAYTPGDRFVTFTLNGVKCALLICFDLRFPELYRRLSALGVQAVIQSFHNGYMDGPGVHEHIMRQTMQAHCGMNGFWASVANSSGYYSRWPGVFIRPDGVIGRSLPRNRAGMMVNTIDRARKFYDPIGPVRNLAMAGQLHSGRLVKDARQRRTKSL